MKVGDLVRAINQPYDEAIPEDWVGIIIQTSGVLDHNSEPKDVAVFWNDEFCDEPHDLFELEVIGESR